MLLEFINPARLHPLLVHLPIGVISVVVLLEIVQRWQKKTDYRAAIGVALFLAAATGILSVTTGWGLAQEGGYPEAILQRHRWLGIGVTAGSVLLWLGHQNIVPVLQRGYLLILGLTAGTLVLTGHYGGVMTHGADYLQTYPKSERTITEVASARVFDDLIQPVLAEKCIGCHKPEKQKGELLLTSIEGIESGGETGPLIDLDAPEKSLLLQRIHLPLSNEEHMPPEGKSQLTGEEKALLAWWINNGACTDCPVSALTEPEPILAGYLEALEQPEEPPIPALAEAKLDRLRRQGIRVNRLAEDSPWVTVDLSREQNLDRKTFTALRRMGEHIRELNLGFSNFSDALAPQLRHFTNLEKLALQRTAITDETLQPLSGMNALKSLNVYGTDITKEGLSTLEKLPALSTVYLWQTGLSNKEVAEVFGRKPEVQPVLQTPDSIFGKAQLNPPVLEASSTIIYDSVVVRLVSTMKDVIGYYTTDGSEPDSIARVFPDSLVLRASTQLKVKQYKAGWEPSSSIERNFVRARYQAENADLLVEPGGRYVGNGGQTLIDFEKGSTVFTEGKWLGFEGKHMEVILKLREHIELTGLTVSALSAPGNWIFFPRGIEVSASSDGKTFRKLAQKSWPLLEESVTDASLRYFTLDIAPTETAYLKVKVLGQRRNPDWHPAPGGESWLFLDEILLN